MSNRNVRKMGVAGTLGVSAVLAVGAVAAWACTSLATLSPNPLTASPGERVTVTGENFVPDAGPVTFRFSSKTGPVLGTTTPNRAGDISTSFRVPVDAAPGSYVLLATQVQDGEPVFGTPARSVLVVPGPNGETVFPAQTGQVDVTAEPQPAAAADPDERLSSVLLVVTGVAGLGLFIAGLAAFAASVRRRPEPQVQR